jgi:hypothetical protein
MFLPTVLAGNRNLILGIAEGLQYADVKTFVCSLRKTAFSGDVLLFVADADERTHALLHRHDIAVRRYRPFRLRVPGRVLDPRSKRFLRIQRLYPSVVRALAIPRGGSLGARSDFAARLSGPNVARYFRYYSYLVDCPTEYRSVMLTDVRDVLFQSDPFEQDLGPGVCFFLEDERLTLGSEPHNRIWLERAYGKEIANELARLEISCSGVTIGTRGAVIDYLRAIVAELLRIPGKVWNGGGDQAVHNYIVRRGLVPQARLVGNGEGPVLTLGTVPHDEVGTSVQAAVVHQYDRHPRLVEALSCPRSG